MIILLSPPLPDRARERVRARVRFEKRCVGLLPKKFIILERKLTREHNIEELQSSFT